MTRRIYRPCHWRGCRERASRYLCRSHFNALPFSIQAQLLRATTPDEESSARDAVFAYMTSRTLPTRDVAPAFSEPRER